MPEVDAGHSVLDFFFGETFNEIFCSAGFVRLSIIVIGGGDGAFTLLVLPLQQAQ